MSRVVLHSLDRSLTDEEIGTLLALVRKEAEHQAFQPRRRQRLNRIYRKLSDYRNSNRFEAEWPPMQRL